MPFTATILCVDDDEDDLFFIREVIDSQGHDFRIEEAHNGWEAMNYLTNAISTGALPCLVIMDMNMPRMDGKETIKKIREQEELNSMPVVVFTTSSNIADKKYFESQGIHFITKPFDYKVFTRQIIELLSLCANLGG
jgi:CheY-like chemotaxis protein